MRHAQKIAIARLISDLIKSDDIICQEEIALYNQIVSNFEIIDSELYEAQSISLSDAVSTIQQMTSDDKRKIYSILHQAAYSDNSCVAREALLLLTLSLTLDDSLDKYHLFSTSTHSWQGAEKYVMYIESDYMPLINEEIRDQYDIISNVLHLWKFEFIYIPKLASSFRDMDRQYLCDIIRYMNPRLPDYMLDALYERLTSLTTVTYTRDYISHMSGHSQFYDIEPSLLVNVGFSHVPATIATQDFYYANFLTIRLEDEPNAVLNEVRRFLDLYETFISEPEYHRPKRGKNLFHYHGFYKQLFDFFARHYTMNETNGILIDMRTRKIWMRGIEIPLSATQLATYVFILYYTHCTYHQGLIKAGQHHPLSDQQVQRLGHTFHSICNLFRDTPAAEQRSYMDDVPNIRGYIARIRAAIEHYIPSPDSGYYLPKDTADKAHYHVTLNPDAIIIRDARGETPFCEYPFWKQL